MNKRTVLITIGLLALVVAVLAIAQSQFVSAASQETPTNARAATL